MAKSQQDFSKKFQELEKITEHLQNGDLDLEESMKLFEQGSKLASELKQQLKKTENKIKKIK